MAKKDILSDLVLPSDEEVRRETHRENNRRAITQPDVARRKSDATKQQWANGRKDAIENIRKAGTEKWKDPKYREQQRISRAKSGQYTDPTKAANYKGAHIGTCIVTGKETIYHSPQDLKDAGLAPGNVYNCVNGKRKTTGGQTWRRV